MSWIDAEGTEWFDLFDADDLKRWEETMPVAPADDAESVAAQGK